MVVCSTVPHNISPSDILRPRLAEGMATLVDFVLYPVVQELAEVMVEIRHF